MKCASSRHGAGGVEDKRADGRIETVAVFGHEKIAALHGAAGRAQAAAIGVLEGFAGTQQGLLTDHTQTFDFFAVTALVLDHPMAGNQLNRHPPRVGDGDGVSKSKHIL